MKMRVGFVANSSSSDYIAWTPFEGHNNKTIDLCHLLVEAGYDAELCDEYDRIWVYPPKGHSKTRPTVLYIDNNHNITNKHGASSVKINLADPKSLPILLAWLDAEE